MLRRGPLPIPSRRYEPFSRATRRESVEVGGNIGGARRPAVRSVQHERAVVTHWNGADGVGSARTVDTRRDVFISWFTVAFEVANTLSVGSEIPLDYERVEGGQDRLEWRGCGDTRLWRVVLASGSQGAGGA